MTTLKKLDGQDLADPRDVLKLHGIKVWNARDINVYKRAQIQAHTNWAGGRWGQALLWVSSCAINLGLSLMLIFTVMLSPWYLTALSALILITFCPIKAKSAEWKVVPAEVVRSTMPAFAKAAWETAAKRYPYGRFTVAELRDKVTDTLLDPILSVDINNHGRVERIAIAVWDENNNEVLPPGWK